MPSKRKRVGLALSGGAVLGIAHIGVIKVLEKNKIPIDMIAGTSAGSMAGAFLAAGITSDQMFEMVKSMTWGKISKLTIPKMGLLNSKLLERFIDSVIGRIDFYELKKPFAAVTVDLSTGKQVVLRDGFVSEAVRASCAIPGVFTPVIRSKQVLVDGGVLNFLPTDVVREMGADYIIAVKIMPSILSKKPPENIVQVLVNSFQLTIAQIAEHAPNGDVTIVPDLTGLNSYDFEQAEKLYQRGYDAAANVIEKIKQDLGDSGVRLSFLESIKKYLK
jgi:NTE family protein